MQEQTLTQAFSAIAISRPTATAVQAESEQLTYRDLAARSEMVARTLRAQGIQPGSVVVVRMAPGSDTIAVLLGILRAGAAYLPLHDSGAAARDAFIISDARPVAIVTDAEYANPGIELTAGSTLQMLEQRAAPVFLPDTAYVIYTSGTTGSPKGVPVSHKNVLDLFAAASPIFRFDHNDRWLLYHSIAFDFSVWEIWGAFLHGGCLVVPDRAMTRDPDVCADLIRREHVTVLNQTPTAFGILAPALTSALEQHELRHVIFGGEALRPSALESWVNAHGLQRPVLTNMYGITEVTVHATSHQITDADIAGNRSVIGKPLPGFVSLVVDDHGQPAPTGELLLAGPQVFEGYLNRPSLDAERLVHRDGHVFYRTGDLVHREANGLLTYLGRSDDQVKVRGYRIELGEVEAAFMALPDVAGVIATTFSLASEESLGCVYTTAQGTPLRATAVRKDLRDLLPSYMTPTKAICVQELPKTPNGKADRRRAAMILETGNAP